MERELSDNDAAVHSLLGRLAEECDEYISHESGRRPRLWAGSVEGQIAKMRECYRAADVKPTWITPAKIDSYEYQMFGARAHKKGSAKRDGGSSLPRDWYLRLETSCIAPIEGGSDAVVFVPAYAETDDGTPIGGYSAVVPLSETVRESLPMSKFAMIKIDPAASIHLERIGSPDLDMSAHDLMRALRRGRDRQGALFRKAPGVNSKGRGRSVGPGDGETASRAPMQRRSKPPSRDPTRKGGNRTA